MESSIDKQQYLPPPSPGDDVTATAPFMRDDDYNPPTAYGYEVGPPPYLRDGTYQGQGYPFPQAVNQGHPIYQDDPPPYDFTEINQEKTAPETGCAIFLRCIKKAGGVALITLAGIGGFVLTIALSPFFGMYIVGKAMSSGGCFICVLDENGAKVVGIILLAAVAIASLPVIVCSPIFAMDFAYRAGRSLYGEEFNAPGILVDSHEFVDNLWNGCASSEQDV